GLASGVQPFRLGSVDNNSFLPRSVPTYYQRLRDHGYRVGCVGKLDLAKPDRYNGRYGDRPCVYGWGFTHPEECEGKMHAGTSRTPIGPYTHYLHERGLLERFYEDYKRRASMSSGGNASDNSHGARDWIKGASYDSVLPTDDWEDCYIGRRAAEWIDNIPDDFPWHMFVSFVGPHDPFDPPKEYADRYRDAQMPAPIPAQSEGKPRCHEARRRSLTPDEVAVTQRQYCAEIEAIDDHIGRIMDALERRGMLDNTIIIYTSDHGEMLGDHGMYTKSVPYEAALHVPLLISGPGIPSGRVTGAIVELIDVNPTICELSGLPRQENIDALSLAPVLQGADSHRPDALSVLRNFECLRTETHKLIVNHNDCVELYDLQQDPRETSNIAEANSEIVSKLRRRLRERIAEGKWLH
ncbi:MAG: sulfatase-like hydrolase/transferase, partial [Planctomycetes bacterium]|nr:sulfatase-like hydrolase/transferase [Planctomycetota bacterium]